MEKDWQPALPTRFHETGFSQAYRIPFMVEEGLAKVKTNTLWRFLARAPRAKPGRLGFFVGGAGRAGLMLEFI